MINLGASSDSLMMNVDTDLGPLVSLELNSLFPSSLHVKLAIIPPVRWYNLTSGSRRKVVDSRIVRLGYGEIQPWVRRDAQNRSSSAQSKFELLY
jgi:hypothetical protein